MIDLHSHLLPGVDDGSRSVERSLGVLRRLAAQGVTDICLTPHLRAAETAHGPPARHEEAFEALRTSAPDVPRLHRGAEVMLDRPLPSESDRLRRVTLGGTRYILVEFPRLVTPEVVATALTRIRESGLIAVVAHPERYSNCSPEVVAYWRAIGARMQVDATTLQSPQARGQRARQLVAHGLGDILAGDNHGDDRSIVAGVEFLLAQEGAVQAELLATRNPGAILRDEPLEDVPPLSIRRTWMQRLKQLLEGR